MAVLVDTNVFKLTLVESDNGSGRLVARGPFARADIPTANGRVYTGKLWEREIKKLGDKIERRSCFGMLDHPKDGKTALQGASHLVTDLSLNGDTLIGEAEILATPNGSILKALIESGASIGISSRGVGTTRKTGDGKDEVQDDYNLLTFDFVADPANATSWPEFHAEDTQAGSGSVIPEDTMGMTIDELRENYPDEVQKIIDMAKREALAEQPPTDESAKAIERRLISMVREERETIEEQVRSEAMSDPAVGGARLALESVSKILRPYLLDEDAQALVSNLEENLDDAHKVITGKDAENEKLRHALTELMSISEELGRRYYMQAALSLIEDGAVSGRIVSLVGSPMRYGTNDEFKSGLKAAIEMVRDEAERTESESEAVSDLAEENEALRAALNEATDIGKKLAVRAYAERRLAHHPQAAAIRRLVDENTPSAREDVDALVESFENEHPPSEDFEMISASMGGGLSHLTEGEETVAEVLYEQKSGSNSDGNGDFLGVDMAEIRSLAGLSNGGSNGDNFPY